jgi:uncharacterized membrane protein
MATALELIVAVFNDAKRAREVLGQLRTGTRGEDLELKNAAVLVKDANGRVQMDETEDVKPGRGALFGAVTGALVGLLAGPAGAVAGALAGAATGGITAAVVDMGFTEDQLAELRASMPANSSALVALIEHTWVQRLTEELENRQGKLFRHEVAPGFRDRFADDDQAM